jgi:hypothetical protein
VWDALELARYLQLQPGYYHRDTGGLPVGMNAAAERSTQTWDPRFPFQSLNLHLVSVMISQLLSLM